MKAIAIPLQEGMSIQGGPRWQPPKTENKPAPVKHWRVAIGFTALICVLLLVAGIVGCYRFAGGGSPADKVRLIESIVCLLFGGMPLLSLLKAPLPR